MKSLIKYTFISVKGRLWFLLGFMLLSLSSNLFFNFLPEPWDAVAEIVWRILFGVNYFIVLLALSTSDNLKPLCYRQIPLKPYNLILSHSIMLFTVASAFITSWIAFAPFVATMKSDEILLNALLNILYRSLNITSIPLLFMLLSTTIIAAKSGQLIAFLTGFLTLLFVLYIWLFPGNLNPFASIMFEPLRVISGDNIATGELLLQSPLETVLRKSLITATTLVLKFFCLSYMLEDKIDI